jgi:chemotaxis signal transduction protein
LSANTKRDVSSDEAELPTYVLFAVGGAAFAIEVTATDGVVDCPRLTPLPDPPDGIIGAGSVRGRMTVVMDLSRGSNWGSGKHRLVLLKGESRLGLLADRVSGVTAIGPAAAPAIDDGRGWPIKSFVQYERESIPVLDVERLIA